MVKIDQEMESMMFWSSDKDTRPFSSPHLGFLQKGDYAMILTEKFSLLLFGKNEERNGVWGCFEGVTRASRPITKISILAGRHFGLFFPEVSP